MQKLNFVKVVEQITEKDPRYVPTAYSFVREGLDHTLNLLKKNKGASTNTHVSCSELLEGLRDYTIKEFGPMGKTVLNEWGINNCADFGNIVFNMVEHGVLGKSENDRLDAFEEIWSFDDAFVKPFLPEIKETKTETALPKSTRTRRTKSDTQKPSTPHQGLSGAQ